jgi:hypothetical protein
VEAKMIRTGGSEAGLYGSVLDLKYEGSGETHGESRQAGLADDRSRIASWP